MALGSLVVTLGLDAVDYKDGLTKAELEAKRFHARMMRDAVATGTAIGTLLGEGLKKAFTATVDLVKATDRFAKSAGDYQDLAEMSGASAESLAALAISAGTAGTNVEAVAQASIKLTKNLTGVDDDSKAAGAAIKALGLNIKDFKAQDPTTQIETVSKALAGFEDGASKTAVAVALFGKSGAELLPFLKQLNEDGGRQVILTQKQIELADAYADKQAKLNAQIQEYAKVAAVEALPAITAFKGALADTLLEIIGLDKATGQLAQNSAVADFAKTAVEALAFVIDAADGLGRAFSVAGKTIGAYGAAAREMLHGDLKQARQIGQEYRDDIDKVLSREFFSDKLKKRFAEMESIKAPEVNFSNEGRNAKRPTLKFDGEVKDSVSAELKKRLDGQVKLIREFAHEQADAFQFANRFVDGVYQDGNVSLREFFDTQARIRSAGVDAQIAALDKEIAALEDFKRRAPKKEDRIDAENKIAEAMQKRAAVAQKAGQDGILAAQEEARATSQLKDRYDELRASILQMQGDTAAAARIRIDKQVEDARRLITQAGGNPAEAERLRAGLEGQQALSEAQRQYNRLLEQARNSEEALMLSAAASGSSELDTLRAVGSERAKSLAQLDEMVKKANELALSLGTPEAIRFAEQLGLQFRRATAEVDPLLLKIRDVGKEMGESIAGSFEEAIVSGKGLRETLAAIEQDIVRIVTRNLVTKPLGDYLSNLIGGNGQSSGGGGFLGGIGNFFGSLFGGGLATGGAAEAGGLYRVNERRTPEMLDVNGKQFLMMGNQRGRVDPNPKMGGGKAISVVNHFTVAGNVDRRSQAQVAAAAGAGVQRALGRDN